MFEKRALTVFLLIAFGVAWPLFLLPILFGPPASPARQVASLILWAAAMWAPGVAALIVTRFVAGHSLRTLHLDRLGPKRMYLWAWLVPPALVVAAGIVSWAAGAGTLDLSFPVLREALAAAPDSPPVPVGVLVALQIASALLIAPIINTVFALGEELGWRGYLLPALLPLGQDQAIVASGVIWGVWHAPAILQGYNYPTQPVLGVALMTVFTVLIGTFFGWLYLCTGSPWAPALGHASLNATAGIPLLFLTGTDSAIGGIILSPLGWIPVAAFIIWLLVTKRLPAPVAATGNGSAVASVAARVE